MIFLIMTEYNNTAMIFKAVLFELVEKVDTLLAEIPFAENS